MVAHGAGGGGGRRVRRDGRRPRGWPSSATTVTLLERGRGSAARWRRSSSDGFTWDAGPTHTLLPAVRPRPVPQVRPAGGARARAGAAGRAPRAPLRGRHVGAAARSARGPRRSRRSTGSATGLGPAVGRPRAGLRRRLGGAAPRVPRAPLGPRPPARPAGRTGCAAARRWPSGSAGLKDERLRLMATARRRSPRATTPRRARLGRRDGVRRAAVRRVDRRRRDGRRSPTPWRARLATRKVEVRTGRRGPRPGAARRPGGRGRHRRRASSTPTSSWSRATRGGCPPWRRSCSGRCRPCPRWCATSGSRATSRTCPTRPCCTAGNPMLVVRTGGRPPTAPPRGRCWAAAGSTRTCCSRWPGAASTCAPRSSRGSTAPRATWSSAWGGSPLGVLWQGRRTAFRRLGPTTPVPGVYAAGAHATPGAGLPYVGLSAALVAQLVGPA